MKTSIVVDGVTYYTEHPDLTKAKDAIDKWEWIRSEILLAAEQGQALYDNMKEEGLTFGVVEAEGFLRCAKTLKEKVKIIEESFYEIKE